MHDCNLMDVILASGKFTSSEIHRLNYCRLYLKATTLSDLTQPHGKKLDWHKLHGSPSLFSSRTRGISINQERPSYAEWALWKKANSLWSTEGGVLYQPLGDWVLDIHDQRQQHFAYWSDSTKWISTDGGYVKCKETNTLKVFQETNMFFLWGDLPKEAIPIQSRGMSTPGHWKVVYEGAIINDVPSVVPSTFDCYINTLPEWEIELLKHVLLASDPFTVADKLDTGVRTVSDGSEWSQTQGAFGWSMSDPTGARWATGMGPAHGSAPSSYRSESYGMLSILCFLRRLAEFTGRISSWRGIVATDSQSLLDTLHLRQNATDNSPGQEQQSQEARLKLFSLDPCSQSGMSSEGFKL
jgi:hypothetical protein